MAEESERTVVHGALTVGLGLAAGAVAVLTTDLPPALIFGVVFVVLALEWYLTG